MGAAERLRAQQGPPCQSAEAEKLPKMINCILF